MSNGEIEQPVVGDYEEAHERKAFALGLLEFNSTLAARIALGHGIDRETVGACLRDLAYAIETQDVAEDMSPVGDGNILAELDL
jgi:hypothetical protein